MKNRSEQSRPTRAAASYLATLSVCVALAVALASAVGGPRVSAAEPPIEPPAGPLFEGLPFDRITLGESSGNAVFDVTPLERPLPDPFPRSGKLTVGLLKKDEKLYDINWTAIVKVEFFEQLVLREVNALVGAVKLDEAFDQFQFLLTNYPDVSGLDASIDNYLYTQAGVHFGAEQFDAALALLRELHDRDPNHGEVEESLGTTVTTLVDSHVRSGEYWKARLLISDLAARYPRHPVVAQGVSQLTSMADGRLAELRAAVDSGRLGEAHAAGRDIQRIWPELPGAREAMRSLQDQYPRVVVGVTSRAFTDRADRLDDWAARRTSRLAYRTLAEFTGPGAEGGQYASPLGSLTVPEESLGRRLVIDLRDDIRWASGDTPLSAFDLARQLLAMADPGEPCFLTQWEELLQSVSVQGPYRLELELRRPSVRPQAFLQIAVVPYAHHQQDGPADFNGPYIVGERSEEETIFLANARYFDSGARPREIVERHFAKGSASIRALLDHQVDVLDRVNPWQVESLRREESVVVERYAVPLVYCLIPNMTRPLMRQRAFRRALAYGINRQAILDRLLAGQTVTGSGLITGPFLAGVTTRDPLDYAYNRGIDARPYSPHLAIALAEVARMELAEKTQEAVSGESSGPWDSMPDLVLAHPPHETARLCVEAIRHQLTALGIPVQLLEIDSALPRQVPLEADLLYAELAVWEPAVDARRLLGENGMARGCGAHMGLALRQLDRAADWGSVGGKLREIHQIAHDEVSVIPLWQLVEHFAYRGDLLGAGKQPVSLYQDVEQWKPAFFYVTDQQ